ncbi:unnamed protein product [Prunus armeniaca]
MEVFYNTEDKALMLLTSLPPSYKHFQTALMLGKSSLNFEEVVQDIMMHHVITQHSGDTSQDEGLVANIEERGRSKDKKKKGKKETDTTEVVTDDGGELLCINSNVNSNVSAISSKAFSSDWILDFGCSYHMCSNKEWFDTYEKEEEGEVMMGDGSVCRVKSIDSIKVKMHDCFVRLLGMVRYITKLSKNLISLDSLDKSGYTFKANRGKLIISKGSLVIIKPKIQPNCLYRLCGTVVTGGAVVSTSKDLEDETQLWHLRSGHISE